MNSKVRDGILQYFKSWNSERIVQYSKSSKMFCVHVSVNSIYLTRFWGGNCLVLNIAQL